MSQTLFRRWIIAIGLVLYFGTLAAGFLGDHNSDHAQFEPIKPATECDSPDDGCDVFQHPQDNSTYVLNQTVDNAERIVDIEQCLARKADPTAEQIPFPEPTPGGTETTNLLIDLGYCNPPLDD